MRSVDTPTRTHAIPPIDLALDVAADPATTWRAITEPDRVAEWFTVATPLGSVGQPYRLDFGDGTVVAGVVTALEAGRSFSHTWSWEAAAPDEVTEVTWTVEALPGGGSRVRLVHEGWDATANAAARDDHESYWAGYLDDLRDILEEA